jgi:hypothetical protein
MNLSNHASERCHQRGIPPVAIDVVLDFGAVEFHRGREIFSLDKKGLRKAKHYLGKLNESYLAVLKDIYVVVSGETVVTVSRKTGHLKRNRQ